MIRRWPALIVTLVLMAPCPAPLAAPAVVRPYSPGRALELDLLARHNAARAAEGLPPLAIDPRLTAAARLHAAECARRGAIEHIGLDGSYPGERFVRLGYAASVASENGAMRPAGEGDVGELMEYWMGLPADRPDVLGPYRDFGAAVATGEDGRTYWICCFGRPS